jgi:hypothetical protein
MVFSIIYFELQSVHKRSGIFCTLGFNSFLFDLFKRRESLGLVFAKDMVFGTKKSCKQKILLYKGNFFIKQEFLLSFLLSLYTIKYIIIKYDCFISFCKTNNVFAFWAFILYVVYRRSCGNTA